MPEKCNEPCPDLTRLEQQLKDLQTQNGNDHKEMRDRLTQLEKEEAVQVVQYKTILDKLDSLTEKVGALEAKPAKRWESLVGCALSALVGAFLLWLAAGMPGAAK